MASPPKPVSPLHLHRVLSPSAGVRVSPLCLGGMNFGDSWNSFMGEMTKQTCFEILDYFFEQGGNFIDTAPGYQEEQSEEWIGEWMASRKNRDQMIIATKYTSGYPGYPATSKNIHLKSNYCGNSKKNMRVCFEASLKKLQTDYIDIYYVHWWDFSTSIPEMMQSLNRLVDSGKVLYLGISDTPAWVVSKANEYARNHGLAQFSVYQGYWNAALRDFERDILPMCEAEGMALAPFGALGGGKFKTKKSAKDPNGRNWFATQENEVIVAEKLEQIAEKKGTAITSVALAYITHKAPYVYPIVGGRKVEHLKGNIEALSLELTQEEIDDIESAIPFNIGFPMNVLYGPGNPQFKYKSSFTYKDLDLLKNTAPIDGPEKQQPIKPRKV